MGRFFRAAILMVLVASCGSREFTAPGNLDNACSIVSERPEYMRAFQRTQDRWNIPVPVLMAIIYQESRFVGNARPPHNYALGVIPVGRQSSALGYSQALDATWAEYQADIGGYRARRDDIWDATDFMGWYMNLSLAELGIPLHDTRNQYLAYHDGRTGFRRGTWRSKPWLIRIAGELEGRAVQYQSQLRGCGQL